MINFFKKLEENQINIRYSNLISISTIFTRFNVAKVNNRFKNKQANYKNINLLNLR